MLIDWRNTRFLGLSPADYADALNIVEISGGDARRPVVTDLLQQGYLKASPVLPSAWNVRLWLSGINVLIRTLGFGRAVRFACVLAPVYNRRDVGGEALVGQLKDLIEGAGRRSWLVSSDCKTEALTAFILARRMGLDARLCVGMREHPLGAHSWTECCGVDIPKRDPRGYEFPVVLTVTL
ncbi:MAG: lasso peptide biosynthesis B2 protein [Mycobacterium leprae]